MTASANNSNSNMRNHLLGSFEARSQQGRTLLELIIAMAIGLVIVAGVSSLYLSSSGVSRVANQVAVAEDGGQLAMFVIGDAIRMAGFGEIVGSSATSRLGQTQFEGAQLAACSNGTFADPFASPPDLTCVAGGPGDQLLVSYQSDNVKASSQGALTDCLGQSPTSAADLTTITRIASPSAVQVPIATNVFWINANGQFACRGRYGVTPQALVANTENFKVFFGFDNVRNGAGTTGVIDLVPMARQWVTPAQVNAAGFGGPVILGSPQASPWDSVISVLVCITTVTNQTGLTTAAVTTRARCPETPEEVATGLDINSLPLNATDTDGFIRRTVTQVFAVRANSGLFAAFN